MIEIPLTKGHSAKVDDEDFWVSLQPWFADVRDGQIYASRNRPKDGGGPRGLIRLHQVIMIPPPGMEVDHINRDTLDNQRSNLRLVTKTQNQRNRGPCRTNAVGIKGVCAGKRGRGWRAQIGIGGRTLALGTYDSPEQAALAYDCVALAYFGTHAALSSPGWAA
jgi:hypothetical protein